MNIITDFEARWRMDKAVELLCEVVPYHNEETLKAIRMAVTQIVLAAAAVARAKKDEY